RCQIHRKRGSLRDVIGCDAPRIRDWLGRRSSALNEQDVMSLRIVEYSPCIGAATTAPDHAISANPFQSMRKVSDLKEQHCLIRRRILFNSLSFETYKVSWCHKLDVMSLLGFGEFESQDLLIESPRSWKVFEIEFHADEREGGQCHG